MTYQQYIHEQLKKMSFLERVNSQSKQINLTQGTLVEIANPTLTSKNLNREIQTHMGADAGIQYVEERLFKKEMTEEPILFDHAEWDQLTKKNIEKDFAWKMEDRQQKKEKAFKAIQARSFEKASMMALYGGDSLETYEESSNS